MVKISTDTELFNIDGIKRIISNDGIFNVQCKVSELDDYDREMLRKYDDAVILDENLGTVRTRYGVTHIRNISTGLKTLLNIRRYKRVGNLPLIVNITECGSNVLDDVFDECEDIDITCVLKHSDLDKCRDRDFNVDGCLVRTIWDLCGKL